MKRRDRHQTCRPPHCLAILDRPISPAPHVAEVCWLRPTASALPSFNPRLKVTSAVVMELRREGMLLLADDSPPAGTRVLVRLPRLTPRLWLRAVVSASRRMRFGPVELKLDFETKPPGWFLAAASDESAAVN